MNEFDYRDFARAYIQRRLEENKRDGIEELSAYLADWLSLRDRFKKLFKGDDDFCQGH